MEVAMFQVETEDTIYELDIYHAQVNITSRCNMRCEHCRGAYNAKIDLGIEDFERLVDFASQHLAKDGGFLISGGEPLLHPQFKEFISVLRKYCGDDKFLAITTNGFFLTSDTLDFIEALDFPEVRISVSLDSISSERHDSFRHLSGAYKRAIAAIKLIAKRPKIKAIVRATIQKDQLQELESIANLVGSLGVDILSVSSVIPVGSALGKDICFDKVSKKELMSVVAGLRKKQSRLMIDVNDPLAYINKEFVSDEEYGGCIAGIGTFSVEPDGTMLPCPVLPNQPIMNICNMTPEEILFNYSNSPIVLSLVKRQLSGKCGSCKLRLSCGGCRARAEGVFGDYLAEDPECFL